MATKLKNYKKTIAVKLVLWCMVIASTITISNLIAFYSMYIPLINPTMSYEEYTMYSGGMSAENELEQAERAWFSVLLSEEIKNNQFESYIQKQMDYLYQVWDDAGGTFLYDGIRKNYFYNEDTQNSYDVYSLRTIEYDGMEGINKKTFLRLNQRLEADVRYCLEKNLEEWKKQNVDILKEYRHIKKIEIEKTKKDAWIKEKKQLQSYPVYRIYEQYRDMDQRGQIVKNCINFGEKTTQKTYMDETYMDENLHYEYERKLTSWLNETFESIFTKKNFVMGIDQAEYQRGQERERDRYKTYQTFMKIFMGALILCILCSTLLIGIRWMETEIDNKKMNPWSIIGTELQSILCLCFFVSSLNFMIYVRMRVPDLYPSDWDWWQQIFLSGYIGFATIVIGNCILSQVQLLKQRQWWQGFLSVRLIGKYVKDIWNCQIFRVKAMIIIFVLPVLCVIRVLIPVVILLLLWSMRRLIKEFGQIEEGIKRLKEGELDYKIQIESEGTLKDIADNINTISEGLQVSIQREIQSERMKTELISNVSHDIKTPLTSIITYIDLLKQEKIENDIVKDYILVLEQKANRLKLLTDDLFEAAKASSGDMPVHIETVHVQSLIQQTLGEYGEKLEQKGFLLRVQVSEEPLYIKADGKLMWRVLSNLLSNVIKYGVPYSRVYLEIEEENESVNICIKNISQEELNISANELMERFVRGDDSRGTEGSGLGLNIANSLVQLQNGSFKIEIDGDLFKVLVQMPKENTR